jgi:hypothetical protein
VVLLVGCGAYDDLSQPLRLRYKAAKVPPMVYLFLPLAHNEDRYPSAFFVGILSGRTVKASLSSKWDLTVQLNK